MPPPPPSTTTTTTSSTAALSSSIAFSTATLALSKSQRLLASWAPPPPPPPPLSPSSTSTPPQNKRQKRANEEEEKEQHDDGDEDEETFTPLPELAGLGAAGPPSSTGKDEEGGRRGRRGDQTGLESLRRELLGKGRVQGIGKVSASSSRAGGLQTRPGVVPVPVAGRRSGEHGRLLSSGRGKDEDEDEEEGGRSSLGKPKEGDRWKRKGREEEVVVRTTDDDDDGGVLGGRVENGNEKGRQMVGKRGRGTNYLDEVLARRALKRRKKKKEEGKGKGGDLGDGNNGGG